MLRGHSCHAAIHIQMCNSILSAAWFFQTLSFYVELFTQFLIFPYICQSLSRPTSAEIEDQSQLQQFVDIMRDVVDVALATDMALACLEDEMTTDMESIKVSS